MILNLLKKVWLSGGIPVSENRHPDVRSEQKRMLTAEFITKENYLE